jgi:urease accessory protein
MTRTSTLAIAAGLALVATPGLAHTGAGAAGGFAAGLAHPPGGLDHLLAMIAVGLSAALIGGRALWAMPLGFMAAMAAAGAAAVSGLALPFVELGIGLSVVAIGAMAAMGASVPAALGVAVAAIFALFHGHAHGTEMPATVSGLTYGAGFLAATGALHLAGIGLGAALLRIGPAAGRALGGAVAALGIGVMTGAV